MRELKAVLKSTAGEDIICLEVLEGSRTETLLCLGKRSNVRLPLKEILREKIEETFGAPIEWDVVEKRISEFLIASR